MFKTCKVEIDTKVTNLFTILSTLWLLIIMVLFFSIILILNKDPIVIVLANSELWRTLAFYLAAIGVGPIGLLLTAKKAQSQSIQITLDSDKLSNELYSKAIDHLGSDSDSVRQGGIYTLKQLMETNVKFETTVLRILTSYIRVESQKIRNELNGAIPDIRKTVSSSIEAAVEVIRDRKKPDNINHNYDLSNTLLYNVDFSGSDLSYFNLSDSTFYYCGFNNVNFNSANLASAKFIGCDINKISFTKAIDPPDIFINVL